MYPNYPNYNNGMYNRPQGGGMVYNNQYQAPVMTNALTPEQIKELRRSNHQAAIPQVTQLELMKAVCTHRDTSRNCMAIVDTNDGTGNSMCTICGEVFKPVEYTKEQVEEIANEFMDILQTAKMNYLDMSPAAVSEFFKIIPLIKRTPELYKQAMDCFAKYDRGHMFNEQSNNNFFSLFSALTNPNMSYGPMGGMQQPPYAPQYAYGQGPVAQPPYDPYVMQQQAQYGYNQGPMVQPPYDPYMGGGDNPFYQPSPQQASMLQRNQTNVNPNAQGQQATTVQPTPAKADVKNVLNS